MAIDTREKRQAMIFFGGCYSPAVTPNVAKDAEWRQEVLCLYPGIALGSPVAPTTPTIREIWRVGGPHSAIGYPRGVVKA